jgi:hypothetical protein
MQEIAAFSSRRNAFCWMRRPGGFAPQIGGLEKTGKISLDLFGPDEL